MLKIFLLKKLSYIGCRMGSRQEEITMKRVKIFKLIKRIVQC